MDRLTFVLGVLSGAAAMWFVMGANRTVAAIQDQPKMVGFDLKPSLPTERGGNGA